MRDGRSISWDPAKEGANPAKHGLSLSLAGGVLDGEVQTRMDTRSDYGETRFVTYGYFDARLFVVVWVFRQETIRVISLRKANAREQRRYG